MRAIVCVHNTHSHRRKNNNIQEINVLVFTFDAFRQWIFVVVVVIQALFFKYIIESECKDKESAHSFECKTAYDHTHIAHNEWLNDLKVKEAEKNYIIMFLR